MTQGFRRPSRRTFLKAAAASAAALVVGVDSRGVLATGSESAVFNPFVKIAADGTVTVVIKHFEMGQGVTTGLATLVAEELDASWDQIAFEFAPANDKVYANLFFGGHQGVGSSTSIANSFMQYREAGAAARQLLVKAAAQDWGVEDKDITIAEGVIAAVGRTGRFGEFAAAAASLPPPAAVTVKDAAHFRLIGRDRLPRKDSAAKTDGTAVFALDKRVPGMVSAVILRPPKFGAKLKTFDAGPAKAKGGFLQAFSLPEGKGVAVVASSTWSALEARNAITAEWDFSAAETRSTKQLADDHVSLLDQPQYQARQNGDRAVAEAAVRSAAKVVDAVFRLPYLAHAPMEPLNCVIEPKGDGIILHDGCQWPSLVKPVLAAALAIDPEKIEIRTLFAGGSFGRRVTTEADYQLEAALVFDRLGRKTPVKLVWSREDDITGGFYRPMAAHRVRIGLTADGTVMGWDHRLAVKSIVKGTVFEAPFAPNGIDPISVQGAADVPYAIPAFSVSLSDAASKVPVLWWRSEGHTHNAYAIEVAMDMAAAAAGIDPVLFRNKLLAQDSDDHRRMKAVLTLAAEKAGWSGKPVAGKGRGIAVHKSFGTYVAHVVDVADAGSGKVRIERVLCALDCGLVLNPDVVRAQMEGCIGFALGTVMRNAVTLAEGTVEQSNLHDYEPLRMAEMPPVEIHIMPSSLAPTGVGEPGVPSVGPALANAIFALDGRRVLELPMTASGIAFA